MQKLTNGQKTFITMVGIIVVLALALGFAVGKGTKEKEIQLTADQVKSLYTMTWSGSYQKLDSVVIVEDEKGNVQVKSEYTALK